MYTQSRLSYSPHTYYFLNRIILVYSPIPKHTSDADNDHTNFSRRQIPQKVGTDSR